MKKIRLGNDIALTWAIERKDGTPFSLTSLPISLYLKGPYKKEQITNFVVDGNKLSWVYYGKDQKSAGEYSLILSVNEGNKGMLTTDECNAFQLVQSSCMIGGEDESTLTTESLELKTTVDIQQGTSVTVVVDSTLSSTSENPVQNKVITEELGKKLERRDMLDHINFSDSEEVEDVNLDYYTKADADDRFVQKEYGKVLSSNDFTDKDKEKLERMLEDAPQDHKLYGRMDGEWREVTAFSGLTVALALPPELSDEQVTVIIRYGNTTRRLPYRAGFSISNIPAAEEVTVNIKAPDGYIVPASIKYFAKVNVTKQFIGNIEPLVDGLYVYDIFNQNIKSDDWKIENNADAAGIRIVTSEYDFIWATRFADMRIRTGVVRSTAQGILWGMRNVDVTVPPYNLIDSTQENSVTSESITKLSFSNSAKMIEYMDSAFPNWRTDEVTQNEGFIAAAVAARFTPCEDDKIGDWALSDAYMYHLSERTAGFLALQKSVCGWSFSYDNNNGIAILTNLPKKGTNLYYVVANIYGYDTSKNRDAGSLIVPVKVIRGGDLL